MKRESSGPLLSAVFVDYDNIYLSLKRKNEEAAKRFAKDALSWVREIETGRLITPTNDFGGTATRRIVMNRCYGNPVPRRNTSDNSTDMNSFPFVRHHFLRAGFEIVDCPPLTAQLKNSSDIRMVMDVRDYLTHDTYFDEFVILSGDADFTPVLHRLRAHARRTIIFANDYTAAPYTAICDGEVREADLINLLMEGRLPGQKEGADPAVLTVSVQNESVARDILAEIVAAIRTSNVPLPLEALADRAMRALGHEKTVGSNWAGAGSFRELLLKGLPDDIRLTEQPPYLAFEARRAISAEAAPVDTRALNRVEPRAQIEPEQRLEPRATEARVEPRIEARPEQRIAPRSEPRAELRAETRLDARPQLRSESQDDRFERPGFTAAATFVEPQEAQYRPPQFAQPVATAAASLRDMEIAPAPGLDRRIATPQRPANTAPIAAPERGRAPQEAVVYAQAPVSRQPVSQPPLVQQPVARPSQPTAPVVAQPVAQPQPAARSSEAASALQQSIARIHDASQAPPLSPPEYRALFEAMGQEITEQGLLGAQTLTNIVARAQEQGIDVRRDDVRFALEVVSEADPWFEQGASASLFASRFRNFVVGRCRAQGLNLSADEIDLIDAWFAGGASAQAAVQPQRVAQPVQQAVSQQPDARSDRWWSNEEARQQGGDGRQGTSAGFSRTATQQQPNDYAAGDGTSGPADEFPRIVKNRLRG